MMKSRPLKSAVLTPSVLQPLDFAQVIHELPRAGAHSSLPCSSALPARTSSSCVVTPGRIGVVTGGLLFSAIRFGWRGRGGRWRGWPPAWPRLLLALTTIRGHDREGEALGAGDPALGGRGRGYPAAAGGPRGPGGRRLPRRAGGRRALDGGGRGGGAGSRRGSRALNPP